ncbi:glycoside hydrolase family 15 protein [Brachybacterium vulturis]|uniref:glycoside hydrolase family 15 protein n=1 Tax=Brachybacterium vulturis TaxID=2017484 RepID=UPI0037356B01
MTTTSTTPADLDHLLSLVRTSVEVIARHQDEGGAYPASPTFSAYKGYAWFRDGSFIAEGMSRAGQVESVDRFHRWAGDLLLSRAEQVAALLRRADAGEELPVEDMLPTRFRFDGSDGQDPWWDFQTDGYGMWLWQLVEHTSRHGLPLEPHCEAIAVAVDYLLATWSKPCYDWWEEHVEERHPSTLAPVRAGLLAVAAAHGTDGTALLDGERVERSRAVAEQISALVAEEAMTSGRASDPSAAHLAKWFGSEMVDASLAACVVPFGLVEPGSAVAEATLEAVARDLEVDGGVHRFQADVFYGGGQWLLLSALLGWNHARAGREAEAWRHLRWIAAHATDDGEMPEQVPDHLRHPDFRQEWLDRWGPVAEPLLWSHGMYLILADELGLIPDTSETLS